MNLQSVKQEYTILSNRAAMLGNQVIQYKNKLEGLQDRHTRLSEAHAILQSVADEAQGELKGDMDGLVTMAIQSIFGDAYHFDLQIDRTNHSAPYKAIVWETVDGVANEWTPKDDMGGSMMDPIAFVLRVVLRSLDQNPCRGTFWLDEPMKNMGKGELLLAAGAMLRDISHEADLQLIIITHEPELAEIGDRAWFTRRTRGKSTLQLTKGAPPPPKQKRKLR
jgi:hypothetical protein